MKLSELLAGVPETWHRDFVKFVETGEAEQPFLDYLDTDPRGPRAVEQAFSAQANALEELGKHIRSLPVEPAVAAVPQATQAARAVSAAFEKVLALPGQDRQASLAEAAAAIAHARRREPRELEVAAADFREAVEKMVR
jgi:hypothetical protein